MTAGFQYLNPEYGTVSISSDFSNLALRSTHTLGLSLNSAEDWYLGTLTVAASGLAMLAFYADQPAGIIAQSIGNGTMSFVFASSTQGGRPPATVSAFLFDEAHYSPIHEVVQAALVINRQDGANAFDSRKRYLKVIDAFGGYKADTGGQLIAQRNYGSTVIPAVLQSNLYYHNEYVLVSPGPNPPFMFVVAWAAAQRSGNSIIIHNLAKATGPFYPGTGQPPPVDQHYYSYVVVDVAGF